MSLHSSFARFRWNGGGLFFSRRDVFFWRLRFHAPTMPVSNLPRLVSAIEQS
jgi:hypothetical protein